MKLKFTTQLRDAGDGRKEKIGEFDVVVCKSLLDKPANVFLSPCNETIDPGEVFITDRAVARTLVMDTTSPFADKVNGGKRVLDIKDVIDFLGLPIAESKDTKSRAKEDMHVVGDALFKPGTQMRRDGK